ncbi:hypothetical protein KC19_VG035100 [Ceratodon purpureus]|uniref:Secreted protein n=1 Tax=Ceratodon purpureus TaxID=3225 RepID=A0A8T0HLK5_CERPU|nr:hypothetical protein KC19_VG035100 [Ceratodon purpureus]
MHNASTLHPLYHLVILLLVDGILDFDWSLSGYCESPSLEPGPGRFHFLVAGSVRGVISQRLGS